MKNLKLMKTIMVILVSAVLMLVMSRQVFADDSFIDIGNKVNSTTSNTATNATGNTVNNTTNTTKNTTANATNPINNTANKSSYNNTNLPKTGIAESGSFILLIAVFGISAVYAYKKIKDYNNL